MHEEEEFFEESYDDIDELFEWAAQTYQPNQSNTVDLSKYEVSYSVKKSPEGEEKLEHFEVRNKC